MPIETPFTAGYVLVKAGTRDVHWVRDCLLKQDAVWVAHPLIGPDDLICYIDTADPGTFGTALDRGVRGLIDKGVIERTETMAILGGLGKGYSRELNRPAAAAAWLFCDIGVGDPLPIVNELLQIRGVVNAHAVLGRCDIVAYVEAASHVDLMRLLDNRIRPVKNLVRTDTRLVFMDIGATVEDRRTGEQHDVGVQPKG